MSSCFSSLPLSIVFGPEIFFGTCYFAQSPLVLFVCGALFSMVLGFFLRAPPRRGGEMSKCFEIVTFWKHFDEKILAQSALTAKKLVSTYS